MYAEMFLSLALGVGLAAACGFRVFLPLFMISLLTHFDIGGLGLNEDLLWMGGLPAMVAFGVATLLELFAYYLPVVDHALDAIAVPLATLAGTLVVAGTLVDLPPLLHWSLALIAGGGVAGLVKGAAAGTRVASTATTAGLGNPVVATVETASSILFTFLSWFLPVLGLTLVLVLLWGLYRLVFKRK